MGEGAGRLGYLNDTIIGAIVVALAVLIPHGMEMGGGDVPPGWSYNPSTWRQRAPIIVLALVGFFVSRYSPADDARCGAA